MDQLPLLQSIKIDNCDHRLCQSDLKAYITSSTSWPLCCPICIAEKNTKAADISLKAAESVLDDTEAEALHRRMIRAVSVQVGCPG